jgi:hypothetical protein
MDVTTDTLAKVQHNLTLIQGQALQPEVRGWALECDRLLPHVDFVFSMFTPINDQYAPHALTIARLLPDGVTVDTSYTGRGFLSAQSGGFVTQLLDSNRVVLPGEVTSPFILGRWQGFIRLEGFNNAYARISLIIQDTVNRSVQGSGFVVEWVPR